MPLSSNDLVAVEIIKALGLKNVVDLDLRMHLNEIVEIAVRYFPDRENLEKVVPILKKYKLIPIDGIVDNTVIGDEFRNYTKVT